MGTFSVEFFYTQQTTLANKKSNSFCHPHDINYKDF